LIVVRDLRLHRVRDVLLEQLDGAVQRLEKHSKSDASVHDIRKELKRARATLRLLRRSIGDAAYHRDNWSIRDAARPLAPLRDATVLVRTLGRLKNIDDDDDLRAARIALTRQFQEE
jgi:CHAD domain-containing protein